MAGLLPIATSFKRRKLHLGSRRASWTTGMPFAPRAGTNTGHEFHCATFTRAEGQPIAMLEDGEGASPGPPATRAGRVTGSFFHLIA